MKYIKKIIKASLVITSNVWSLIVLLYDILIKKTIFYLLDFNIYRLNPLKKRSNKSFYVLANGPSLKTVIEGIVSEKNTGIEYCVMNFFADTEHYQILKPRYYCLWDPMFYRPDERYDKVQELFKSINELTDWDLDLYIKCSKNKFQKFSGINNPHVKLHMVSSVSTISKGPLRYGLYKYGIAMPKVGTVANACVWVGIQEGYKKIRLFGADMTFFEGICVDEHNRVCMISKHFYDDQVELKPVYNYVAKRNFRLAEYIDMVNSMIKSHDDISSYAKYIGVQITNCCKSSMLDCYEKE